MQPDPTPDLDELTRDVSLAGAHYAHHDPEGRAGLACKACHAATRARNALPWLIRAARERDELRARLAGIETKEAELVGYPEMDVLRKVRNERDELRALLAPLTDMLSAVAKEIGSGLPQASSPDAIRGAVDALAVYALRCGAKVPMLCAENERLRKHIELRASGQDPLTSELRARAERAEAALVARHGGEPIALLAELDEARERAEKAEARAKELEALLGELLPSTKPCVCRKGVVSPEVCAWCRARAALAQKEPR